MAIILKANRPALRLSTDETKKGKIKVSAERYSLTCAQDKPFVYLEDAQGRELAMLFIPSSVHPMIGRDDTVRMGTWQVEASEEVITLWLTAESSVWTRKTYRLRCYPRRFTYEVEVEGK